MRFPLQKICVYLLELINSASYSLVLMHILMICCILHILINFCFGILILVESALIMSGKFMVKDLQLSPYKVVI